MASCTATPDTSSLGLAPSPSFEQPMARTNSLAGEQDAYIQSTPPAATPEKPAAPVATNTVTTSANEATPADAVDLPSAVAFAADEKPSVTPIAGFVKDADGVPSMASATLTVPAAKPQPPVQEQTKTAEVPASQAPVEAPASQAVATAAPVQAAAPASSLPGTSIENRVGSAHASREATVAARPVATASAQAPDQKRGFLSGFFSANQTASAPAPIREAARAPMIAQKDIKSRAVAQAKSEPLVQMASLSPSETTGSVRSDGAALPGVRTTALFEITRKSGINDDSDVDVHEADEAPVRVASAAGMARLAPNGLLKQTAEVDTACLKPSLVRVLKGVEQHYGKKAVITSGYRDPSRNQRARGARNSLHMYCAAADVQIEGVSKWELAAYFRSMPGRGGVGTYCHTDSVHIDVGPERDWNWQCRRKK
jgi:uncharacterized protein YcbK (DUF882 family)